MTWRRINPEDPLTFPKTYVNALFVARNVLTSGQHAHFGYWSGEFWREVDGPSFFPTQVTHWQPLPPLPGEEAEQDRRLEEAEAKLSAVERVVEAAKAIRDWYNEDADWSDEELSLLLRTMNDAVDALEAGGKEER